MSVFDRISKILTPPPRRAIAPPEEPTPVQPREDRCLSTLKSLLPELLLPGDEFAPTVQAAVARLEALAREHGPYKTAAALHQMVSALRDREEDEAEYDRRRGFSFAGDLYLIHLKQCIAEIESKPMGPRVFNDYFVEILDCYHAADHKVKAVEASIRVAEKLWAMSIEVTEHSEAYLAFADRCMETATEVCAQKLEQDRLKEYRMKRHERSGVTPPPMRVSKQAMDPVLLDHLERVKQALARARACHSEIRALYTQLRAQRQTDTARIWDHARRVHYAGLAGPMIERLAALCGRPLPADVQKMALAAAKACETLASAELGLELGGLARSHVAAALRLYRAAGDAPRVQRMEQLLAR